MNTAHQFVKTVEDYALTNLFFQALVDAGNDAAKNVAQHERNTLGHSLALDQYDQIEQAIASALAAHERCEIALLQFVQGDYEYSHVSSQMKLHGELAAAMERLHISGGMGVASALANQLRTRYFQKKAEVTNE